MAYPTVPDLQPFAGNVTPDLRANGPYDTTLTQIENYLKQLGAYVDAQIADVRGEIPSSTDFATTEQLEAVKSTASAAASAAATAQQTAEEASTAAEEAKTDVTELGNEVNTLDGTVSGINSKVTNILNIAYSLPSSGTTTVNSNVFKSDGQSTFFTNELYNVLAHFARARPKGSSTSLLGAMTSQSGEKLNLTEEYTSSIFSAALTAAYEGGITKDASDPALTASDLAALKVSAEGVPYKNQEA